MAPFQWGLLIRRAADRAGYQDVHGHLRGEAFSLGGEVSPSVQVFIQPVTNADVAPIVFFGLHVNDFERDWRARLGRTALPAEFRDDPPFCLNAVNVKTLGERPWSPKSPSDRDVAAVQDWLDRAFVYARSLPANMPGLIAAIEANHIGDHEVWAYLGHPVKVRGFVGWLSRAKGVDLGARLLPLLSDRTEPYAVNAMLGPD
jgi:hypothetical protein